MPPYYRTTGRPSAAGDTFVPAVVMAILCWGMVVFGAYFFGKAFPQFGAAGCWCVETLFGVSLGSVCYSAGNAAAGSRCKDTLNLPKTDFAMEAKLVQNEPGRLAKWREMDLYGKVLESRKGCEKWVLHDGPPFANGDIHIGHLINKTLKDVIIRFRTMQGYQTPYVPGWDCHGLPIEHKIQEQLGSKWREMDVAAVRKLCFEYAQKYAGLQSEQFQRLGILGDWKHPYLTMTPSYEASTLEVFAKFVEAGLVYKKLKPVPWSVSNQTALADAELEYKDVEDTSIFVEFPLGKNEYLLVWTTTPWTLPANLAVSVHPEVEYAVVGRYSREGQARVGICCGGAG